MGWTSQFEQSLDRFLRENYRRPKERLNVIGEDEPAAGDNGFWSGPLFRAVFAAQVADRAERDLEQRMDRLPPDSPPQAAMFLALTLIGRERLGAVYFSSQRGAVKAADFEYLTVTPEVQIGPDRVDFLLTLARHMVLFVDGHEVEYLEGLAPHYDSWGYVVKELVVECDGHEFHERTRQQASHNKQRIGACSGATSRSRAFPALTFGETPAAAPRRRLTCCSSVCLHWVIGRRAQGMTLPRRT